MKGADVNVTIDGRLPLHYASDYGQLDIVKYLCSKVILIIRQNELLYCVTFLKHYMQGAKLDAPDKHGISPLLAAVWEGHTACVHFLLEQVG